MRMNRRHMLGVAGALALGLAAGAASAQEVTLRLHHFLPPQANVPKLVLETWAENVKRDSGGRIDVQIFPGMQLGGTPPELYDQAVDGIADVIWTVVGYTPGRFPQTEVFELPFMVEDARAASYAYWKMYERHMADKDFAETKMIATWVHGPGLFHTKNPVRTPEDLRGMKIRGGSRLVNNLLTRVGAEPVGLPVPAVAEALSKGVIDGTTIPWEVTPALKVPELVSNHTEFEGNGLYTLTFVLAMNQGAYDGLPDDLKAVIDKNAGLEMSIFTGGTQADADGPARQIAVDRGNNIVTITADQQGPWRDLVQPIYDEWIADMQGRGLDGQALIDEARALMAEYHESYAKKQ